MNIPDIWVVSPFGNIIHNASMSILTQVYDSVHGIILHLVLFYDSERYFIHGCDIVILSRVFREKNILKTYLNFLWGMNHNILLDFIIK